MCGEQRVERLECFGLLALCQIDACFGEQNCRVGGADARSTCNHTECGIKVFACTLMLHDACFEHERCDVACIFRERLVDVDQRHVEESHFELALCCILVDGSIVVEIFADNFLDVAQCLSVVKVAHSDRIAQIVESANGRRIVD